MVAFDRQRMTSYWCSKVTSGPDWAAVELQAAKVNRTGIPRTNKSGRVHIDTRRNATQDSVLPYYSSLHLFTGATADEKSEGDLTWGGCRFPSFSPPSLPRLPLLLHPRITHSLPHSSLPLNTARRFGGNLLCCPRCSANNDRKLQK